MWRSQRLPRRSKVLMNCFRRSAGVDRHAYGRVLVQRRGFMSLQARPLEAKDSHA
jgi:hypothetical protein